MNVDGRSFVAPAAPVRTEWAGASGLRIVGDDWGGAGRPVLLLHGGGQTRHSWDGTATALAARGYRAITVDARGHGDSDWDPEGRYTFSAFVADLRALCEQIGGLPILVGASLGGTTALLAEAESEETIASALVLVDVTPRIETKGTERIRAFMTARPDGFASLDEVADAVAAYLPGRSRPRDVSGLAKNVRKGPDGRYRWHWDPAFITGGPSEEALRATRATEACRAVRIPTLLVRGLLSDVVSEQTVAEFLELMPHAKYVDVGGAGHMVVGDRNDAFSGAVVDFLQDLE